MTTNAMLLIGITEKGIQSFKRPTPAGAALVEAHYERLAALLDKPVMISIHWEDGAAEATARIIPADGNDHGNEPFQSFTLPFPKHSRKAKRLLKGVR
jgi:hypothetical protein